jgi:hypothetical protein
MAFFSAILPVVMGMTGAPAVVLAASDGAPPESYLLIVHRVVGDVRLGDSRTADSGIAVKAGDLPDSGDVFTTGPNASLTLRFHPDLMTLEARANARFQAGYAKTDAGGSRRVELLEGRVLAGLSRRGPGLHATDAHTRLRADSGRVSFGTEARASVIFVMEGEAEVRNLATGTVRTVRRGEKAVSDARGLRVSRAQAEDLADAGLGQNVLEVDFWDPVTGEFGTLEMEYEKSP